MILSGRTFFLVASTLFVSVTASLGSDHRAHSRAHQNQHRNLARSVINNANHQLRDEQHQAVVSSWSEVDDVVDYIIVGGGTAGLALAGRLSEDSDQKILVIEAGSSGYSGASSEKLLTPNAAYYNSAVGGEYDWNFNISKQTALDGRDDLKMPRGKVLGGSSAINGLYYVRHGAREAQILGRHAKALNGGKESGWGWHDVKSAMDKSINYQGASSSHEALKSDLLAITNATDVGENNSGPISISYSDDEFDVEAKWLAAFAELGVDQAANPYAGETAGAFIAPTTLNRHSGQRSFSRTAYLDPIANKRKNLQVLPSQTVARVLFDEEADPATGKVRALGVEYAASRDAPRVTVTARREVILSAGAIGSPQILQLSGVGRKELLDKRQLTVVKDLPGVGQNLQDHFAASVQYDVNANVKLQEECDDTFTDSATAYLGLREIFGSSAEAKAFLDRTEKASDEYLTSSQFASTPEAVKRGWKKTMKSLFKDALAETSISGLSGEPKGAAEILLSTMNNQVGIQGTLQSPFSRGYVHITSADPFASPSIDPAYLSHPADLEIMAATYKYIRKIAKTSQFSKVISSETDATSSLKTADQWKAWIRKNGHTEYHPSSTCSMLSEDDGGVVDTDLKVHGFANLRVVDASVIPLSPSSHLVSYVYGIAEIAADKIKRDRAQGKAEPLADCAEEESDSGNATQEQDCDDTEDAKQQQEEDKEEEDCDE